MASAGTTDRQVCVRVFGGPTALFEYGGLRFLTDPTFDAPRDYQQAGGLLTKTAPAAAAPADLGRVDVVLLSHDEHPDNLDHSGRALLADVPLILTTPGGGQRLGNRAKGLVDWESIELARPGGGTITVTGVPAIHGPGAREEVEPITGQVVGFVLTGKGLPTVYVSGDNASLTAVEEIAERFAPVDTAILFAGAPTSLFSSTVRRSSSTVPRPPRPPNSSHDHGHSTAASGLVIAIHIGAMYLPSPLTGRLVDRYGRSTIAAVSGLTLLGAGVVVCAAGESVTLSAAALTLLGLGWNFGLVAGTAIVTDAVPLATRARTQGLVDLTIAIAGAAGGMASGLVVAAAGYPGLAIGGGILASATVPAVAAARKSPPGWAVFHKQ
ncbi:MFS transporter [Nocardia jinanensis]|uniref:Major facilitator superfamily (MFS) profile domain-containing protein n=1 Tax=Nocardia jinanensis TaxID=382504 RepID=A0A917VVY6_9NOCA|nr:MFS transporter [Nocardia jinanensis]GGL30141.1 hypothetical protein GCM10011588_51130 [Nocardia jinanensis]